MQQTDLPNFSGDHLTLIEGACVCCHSLRRLSACNATSVSSLLGELLFAVLTSQVIVWFQSLSSLPEASLNGHCWPGLLAPKVGAVVCQDPCSTNVERQLNNSISIGTAHRKTRLTVLSRPLYLFKWAVHELCWGRLLIQLRVEIHNDKKNKATRHIITQIAVPNGVPLTRSYRHQSPLELD